MEQDYSPRQRQFILETFAPQGHLGRLPVHQRKRRVLLEEFAALVEAGRDYLEAELSAHFAAYYPDYCTVRRELVDLGLLSRQGQCYRLSGPGLGRSSWLRPREQDRREPPAHEAGVYGITHLASGRCFIARGSGVEGRLKSQRAQLELGSHRCAPLQEDWRRHGAEAFRFEVLARLNPGEPGSLGRRLAALEQTCREALGEGAGFY